MKKDVILLTCQPLDDVYVWQNHLYVESCLEQGFKEEQIHILLWKPTYREYNIKWDVLKKHYPNINIFVYEDKGVQNYLGIYIPILRPHLLWQHFKTFPELETKTIIYTDCDILWTDNINISHLLEDGINYISDASSYMNYDYFERKNKEVIKELNGRDFLKEICDLVGVNKQIAIDNNNNTGGVQYILKNIKADFWKKIEKDVLLIRQHLLNVNSEFYENENKGIQSWCADLWAIQLNLWIDREVKAAPELSFAWACDNIDALKEKGIFHNAGITDENMSNRLNFYKGKYINGLSPFSDPIIEQILNNEESKKYCTWYYTNKIKQLKLKYNL